jgi:hypothetical protein
MLKNIAGNTILELFWDENLTLLLTFQSYNFYKDILLIFY